MAHTYPLMLDLSGKLIVVIGGGAVALRKVTGLFAAGAVVVRVVAPQVHGELPHGVEHVAASYEPQHIDGATLVFAATDSPGVNEAVVRDARARGILVNRADDAGAADDAGGSADFATPAVVRDRALTITVSTGGSPALAVRIRDDLAARIDPAWAELAVASQSLRPRVLSAVTDPARRKEIFRALAADDALAAVRAGGAAALDRWLAGTFPEFTPPAGRARA